MFLHNRDSSNWAQRRDGDGAADLADTRERSLRDLAVGSGRRFDFRKAQRSTNKLVGRAAGRIRPEDCWDGPQTHSGFAPSLP